MDSPLIGIDLCEPRRIAETLERTPEVRERLFHPGEQAYAEGHRFPEQHLAARFSAKEAVTKALGLSPFQPLDIEVVGGGSECSLRLHGAAARRAEQLGVRVTISLTHVEGMAGAVALAMPSNDFQVE